MFPDNKSILTHNFHLNESTCKDDVSAKEGNIYRKFDVNDD